MTPRFKSEGNMVYVLRNGREEFELLLTVEDLPHADIPVEDFTKSLSGVLEFCVENFAPEF